MSVKYLEFDSTYRNRNEYPDPSNFVAEIAQSGGNNVLTAKDPISNSASTIYWNSSFTERTAAATSVAITSVDLASTSDPTLLLIRGTYTSFRTLSNFYSGCVLSLTDSTPTTVLVRIATYSLISSDAIGGDVAQVTLTSAIPAGFTAGITGTIASETNNTSTALVPKLFIPTASSADNYYIGFVVQFYNPASANPLTTTQNRTITYYDGITHLATLSATTTTNWNIANGNFVLRRAVPSSSSNIIYPSVNPTTTNTLQLNPTGSSSVYDFYKGSFLRLISPLPLQAQGYSTDQGSYASETKIARYYTGAGTILTAPIGTRTFSLTLSTSSYTTDYYTGGLLTLDYGGANQETMLVTSYNGTTHTGTVSSAWTIAHVAGETWNMNTVVLSSAIIISALQAPQTGNFYEIEPFYKDNWNPFAYNGSLVSSSQEVCYEIELLNLILPNSTMASGRGGRAIFYPFLYVELQPISGNSIAKNVIYSNNPNSNNALFRAVVNDTTQPVYSPFIKIDGNGMVQTVKFKPNDSFRFTVKLPSGELFQTIQSEFFSPSEPNPLAQISAVFAIKRSA